MKDLGHIFDALNAMGYNTEELTIPQVVSIKAAFIKVVEEQGLTRPEVC